MLGLLCSRKSNQSVIVDALPEPVAGNGRIGRPERIGLLISVIRDFISFYDQVSKKMAEYAMQAREGSSEPEADGDDQMTKSSQNQHSGMPLSSAKDNEVAASVIASLEMLRNQFAH